MAIALTISTDGGTLLTDLSSLDDYREVVGGNIGYMHVTDDIGLYVHDEGLLINLPQNNVATRAVVRGLGESRGLQWLAFNGPLRGDVVFIGPADDEGETLALSQEAAMLLIGA